MITLLLDLVKLCYFVWLCVSQEMTYDLHDVLKWEYMLCGPSNTSRLGEEQKEQDGVRSCFHTPSILSVWTEHPDFI